MSEVLCSRTYFTQVAAGVMPEVTCGLMQVFGSAAANYLESRAEIVDTVVDLILQVQAHLPATANGGSQGITGAVGRWMRARPGGADWPLAKFSRCGSLGQFSLWINARDRRRDSGSEFPFFFPAVFLL
jgi:hypothetical protein